MEKEPDLKEKKKDENIKEDELYEVVYDREGCIGAAACCAVNPDNWILAEDGKADFKKKFIGEKELAKEKEAAEVCPVDVIKIRNRKTGEWVI